MVSFTSGAGNPYSTAGGYFLRMPITTGGEAVQVFYAIDGDAEHVAATTVSEGLAHVMLDMSSHANGQHTLPMWLSDSKGVCCNPMSAFFMKLPPQDATPGMKLFFCVDNGEEWPMTGKTDPRNNASTTASTLWTTRKFCNADRAQNHTRQAVGNLLMMCFERKVSAQSTFFVCLHAKQSRLCEKIAQPAALACSACCDNKDTPLHRP